MCPSYNNDLNLFELGDLLNFRNVLTRHILYRSIQRAILYLCKEPNKEVKQNIFSRQFNSSSLGNQCFLFRLSVCTHLNNKTRQYAWLNPIQLAGIKTAAKPYYIMLLPDGRELFTDLSKSNMFILLLRRWWMPQQAGDCCSLVTLSINHTPATLIDCYSIVSIWIFIEHEVVYMQLMYIYET